MDKNRTLFSLVLRRLLDPHKILDYLWLAIFAAWPMLLSFLLGAHSTQRNVTVAGVDRPVTFDGYMDRWNWTMHVAVLPIVLLLLRWLMGKIAPVAEDWRPQTVPPIVKLAVTERGKQVLYQELRNTLLQPANIVIALIVVVVIHVLDMWSVLSFYFANPTPTTETEFDWSIWFLMKQEGGLSKGANLTLVISAYLVQFSEILLAILAVILMLRHNLFFLGRIYQRRRTPVGQEHAYIQIQLDDPEKCFGFREANEAFNIQVLILTIAGGAVLVSRSANLYTTELSLTNILPDVGQWLMAGCWLIALFIVLLPALVKFLPGLWIGSVVKYQREFFSERFWPYGEKPDKSVIDAIANGFATNAFWPTGDNRAIRLFFFSFFVLCFILFPDPSAIPKWIMDFFVKVDEKKHLIELRIAGVIFYGLIAWGLTALLLWIFAKGLGHIDERLVKPNPEAKMPDDISGQLARINKQNIDVGIFISYRRSDTVGYAGRLHKSLLDYVYEDRIFRDESSIGFGEDFPIVIHEALQTSEVMLALISTDWITATDQQGKRRIDLPEDYVRMEIATALERGMRIIPVLLGGATMPSKQDLPESLAALTTKNAMEISNNRWDYDVEILAKALQKIRS